MQLDRFKSEDGKSVESSNKDSMEESRLANKSKDTTNYGTNTCGDGTTDLEPQVTKIPYPKSVFFIITNEFCERFSYYGMKAVLTLYLKNVLSFGEDTATVIYHVFSMLCYFTPIFGAMLADSLLGKFRTILYLSIVYAVGNVVLALAATPPINLPMREISIAGLALIAIGTGGIKPCVSAFGGDQFVLPEQAAQLASFFSIFYFSINAGSLLSTCITPIFRKDIKCFGSDSCYPLAFGVPAVLMVVSLLVFVIGYRWYSMKKPSGNITAEVSKCISHAISEKCKSSGKKDHWLDYAAPKYDPELINSVKQLLKVLFLYIPLPVFWALFDQQGSRWTFQATRMDGEVFGYTIKPDQMQVLNPLLILAFIPIFDQGIYPALEKIGLLKKPLQRLTVGGILAGVAFVISGFLELKLEETYAVKLNTTQSHLNFMSDINCTLQLDIGSKSHSIEPFGQYIIKQIEAKEYDVKISTTACEDRYSTPFMKSINANGAQAKSFLITGNDVTLSLTEAHLPDILEKDGEGGALIKFMFLNFDSDAPLTLKFRKKSNAEDLNLFPAGEKKEAAEKATRGIPTTGGDSKVYKTEPLLTEVVLENPGVADSKPLVIGTIDPKQGGNYVYLVKQDGNNYTITQHTITEPNSIHIMWMVPQFVVITLGEVMFSVTGLQFSFSQAPASMKSVVQAAWLLTVAFGNVIVVFLAEFKPFQEQWKEFFLYAGLMFVDMIIFAVLAYFYVPIETNEEDETTSPSNNVEMKESRDKYNEP